MTRPVFTLPVLLALALSGCGDQEASSTAAPRTTAGPAADQPVLQVTHTGGFTTPTALAARLPVVTVYADGLVLTEGPVIEIFPAPALPNVQQASIPPEEVDRLVRQALDAGVGDAPDLGEPPVADATSTRIVVRSGSGRHEVEAYALAEAGAASGLSADQRAARQRLSGLVQAVTDAAAHGDGQASYDPTSVVALASPATEPDADALPEARQPEVPWPGPELPGEPLSEGLDLGCTSVGGADADAVLDAAGSANQLTPWTSGGRSWSVAFRPLLPGETGCEDLSRAR